jgi:hypothetical protein
MSATEQPYLFPPRQANDTQTTPLKHDTSSTNNSNKVVEEGNGSVQFSHLELKTKKLFSSEFSTMVALFVIGISFVFHAESNWKW